MNVLHFVLYLDLGIGKLFHSSEGLYAYKVLTIFPTCCTAGSNPLILLPPQERTNNQPWTPNRLRASHRCKRHTERYTQTFGYIPFISAMNISYSNGVSGAVVCQNESREKRWGESAGVFGGCVSQEQPAPRFQAFISPGICSLISSSWGRP